MKTKVKGKELQYITLSPSNGEFVINSSEYEDDFGVLRKTSVGWRFVASINAEINARELSDIIEVMHALNTSEAGVSLSFDVKP